MGKFVVAGATLKCSTGSSTSALGVLPDNKAAGENQVRASEHRDHRDRSIVISKIERS
jgi:hypothetical protein